MAPSGVCLVTAGFLAALQLLPLDSADIWKMETKGDWRIRHDHRDLLAVRHTWKPSEEGNFALTWCMATVPAEWTGPVYLSFYCSDDYHTDTWRPDGSWLTAEGFIGHRFKQVLVDNKVVWSEDVSDPVVPGDSPRYRVRLPVLPGVPFRLSLAVYDTVPSTVHGEDDFYQSANNEMRREDDPDASNFMTNVYWGDLVLCEEDTEAPAGLRPSELKVRDRHNERWPLPDFGEGSDLDAIHLEIDLAGDLPAAGFPLQMGIPFASGALNDPAGVQFKDNRGNTLAVQRQVTATWPDESIRWLFAEFAVTPGMDALDLRLRKDTSKPRDLIKTWEEDGKVSVETDKLLIACSEGDEALRVTPAKSGGGGNVTLRLQTPGDEARGIFSACQIGGNGGFRTTLIAEGRFETPDKRLGAFTLYASVFAGLPYAKFLFRYLNDTPSDVPLTGLRFVLTLDTPPGRLQMGENNLDSGFTYRQNNFDAASLNGFATSVLDPVALSWNGGALAPRQFRELFPKELREEAGRLVLDLAAGKEAPVTLTPGEALSHEIWLALGDVEAAMLAGTVAHPPLLENPAYYCATGVIGKARPLSGVPKLEEGLDRHYAGKSWGDLGQSYALRHFPDSPHMQEAGAWANNYYERMLNLWSAWFMSGDREWFERASDVSRHLLDVAIVHSEVPGHDWIGAMHGPGKNHVSGPWNPTLRVAGLELFDKVTGTPGARDAFLGVADYCVRSRAGIDGGSVRQQAGPFDALCTAYWETGEPGFLDEGTARMASVYRTVDRRRGVWTDEHGSRVYRGNVPWMDAQVARPLYWWYWMTGDVEAAQALVGLAESIVCENTDWDTPGAVHGYSHNPHFGMSAAYDQLIIPVVFAAYELTGDPFFLDAATAQWKRWLSVEDFDSIFNTYWNTPWMLWYLEEYNLLPRPDAPEQATK